MSSFAFITKNLEIVKPGQWRVTMRRESQALRGIIVFFLCKHNEEQYYDDAFWDFLSIEY